LHNRQEVSEKTREKVLKIIKEIGYEPNIVARSLANKKNFTVSVLLPKITNANPFWQKPLDGIKRAEAEIQHFGFVFRYHLYDFLNKESFLAECTNILQTETDVVVMVPFFKKESENFTKQLDFKQTPYIFIESKLPGTHYLSFIGQDAYQSGYTAGHLMNFLVPLEASVMIVNITREFDNSNILIERTNGFKSYFADKISNKEINILQLEITDSSDSRNIILGNLLLSEKNIRGIFVPNSRSYIIANYLYDNNINNIHLIGYDLIEKNIRFLKSGLIDFLISQRIEEQGYKSIINVFNHFLLKKDITQEILMPIDLVTKTNVDYHIHYK